MFNAKNTECIGFESRWKVKRVYTDEMSQTTEYSTKEKAVSTGEKRTIEVQTDVKEPSAAATSSDVDMRKLADWLNKIYPQVKKELDEASVSNAFKGYQLSGGDATDDVNCKMLQDVNITAANSTNNTDTVPSRVSALSWNINGKTLAVSCNYVHKTWCHHSGFVAFYTLNSRNDQFELETANETFQTESCVTSLRFHTVLPNVLAIGTYSGTIVILNIDNEDIETIDVNGHDGNITQLMWISDLNSPKTMLLASSSLDGFLTLWRVNSSDLIVKEKYKIKSPLFGRMQAANTVKELKNKVIGGILCFDFSKHRPDMFVVSLEGGLIVQCSMLGTTKLKGSTDSEPLLDPVYKYYQPSNVDINSISFSPSNKDMFMTNCSTNGEIRIYIIGQEDPAQVIYLKSAINCLSWIPFEERIVGGCGDRGVIEIVNLVDGKSIENTTSQKVGSSIMTQMEINIARNNLVAVGTDKSQVQLWNVPWNLFGRLTSGQHA